MALGEHCLSGFEIHVRHIAWDCKLTVETPQQSDEITDRLKDVGLV